MSPEKEPSRRPMRDTTPTSFKQLLSEVDRFSKVINSPSKDKQSRDPYGINSNSFKEIYKTMNYEQT